MHDQTALAAKHFVCFGKTAVRTRLPAMKTGGALNAKSFRVAITRGIDRKSALSRFGLRQINYQSVESTVHFKSSLSFDTAFSNGLRLAGSAA
jgi:hypothetical protein